MLKGKLRENILFQDLSMDDFDELLKISHIIQIDEGSYFIREGDFAERFYFIIEGKVTITKSDVNHEHEHIIAELESGDTVGEMGLFGQKPRSASAKAITNLELLSIPYHELKALAERSPSFHKIWLRITENLSGRIRQASTAVVASLEVQLQEYKIRSIMGVFLINIVAALCLFAFCLSWITSQQAGVISSTMITIPLTLGFVFLSFVIMKSSQFPLATFGLTTRNWRMAMTESILFTSILCFIMAIGKWILIHTSKQYASHAVFEPYIFLNVTQDSQSLSPQEVWWIILILYWLVVTPLQELVVRGALQSSLQIFLTGKSRVFKAILVSNLTFSTAHLFLGIPLALMVFLPGLYFGWLYSRHQNLIGVILAHGILGTWATMILGF